MLASLSYTCLTKDTSFPKFFVFTVQLSHKFSPPHHEDMLRNWPIIWASEQMYVTNSETDIRLSETGVLFASRDLSGRGENASSYFSLILDIIIVFFLK